MKIIEYPMEPNPKIICGFVCLSKKNKMENDNGRGRISK